MVFPLLPVIAVAGAGAAGTALGWLSNDGGQQVATTKKAAKTTEAGGIFPAAESAPFSFNGQSYSYAPDNSKNEQNNNHAAYETYQPVTTDARQFSIQYPSYAININSPEAVATTKKEQKASQTAETSPEYTQPSTFNPSYSQDKSTETGINSDLLIYGVLALAGVFVITKVLK